MRVAVYKRVSTTGQTVDNQSLEIDAWLKSHNVPPEDVTVYAESESAFHANHQKVLEDLTEAVYSGKRKYDVLLVWALDRLTRQGILNMLSTIKQLKVRGCRVVSCKEWFTEVTDERAADVYYALIAWCAEAESKRRSERVTAMHARLKTEGRHSGRPKGKQDKNPNGRRKGGYYLRWQRNKKYTGTEQPHQKNENESEGQK